MPWITPARRSCSCAVTRHLLCSLTDALAANHVALVAGQARRALNKHADLLSHALKLSTWSQVAESAPASKQSRPRRATLRGARYSAPRGSSRDGSISSSFKSFCKRCGGVIAPNSRIKFDAQARKYVHARYAVGLSPVSTTPTGCASSRKRRGTRLATPITRKRFKSGLVHGLKPGTLETYHQEWDKYVHFALRRGCLHVRSRA